MWWRQLHLRKSGITNWKLIKAHQTTTRRYFFFELFFYLIVIIMTYEIYRLMPAWHCCLDTKSNYHLSFCCRPFWNYLVCLPDRNYFFSLGSGLSWVLHQNLCMQDIYKKMNKMLNYITWLENCFINMPAIFDTKRDVIKYLSIFFF